MISKQFPPPSYNSCMKNTYAYDDFIHAILKGRWELALQILKKCKDIDINRLHKGLTPLTIVSSNYNCPPKFLKKILSYPGIRVNEFDSHNRTCLMHLTSRDALNDYAFKKLLKHKDIDLNLRDNFGYTALMHSIINSSTRTLKLLHHKKTILTKSDMKFLLTKALLINGKFGEDIILNLLNLMKLKKK